MLTPTEIKQLIASLTCGSHYNVNKRTCITLQTVFDIVSTYSEDPITIKVDEEKQLVDWKFDNEKDKNADIKSS